MSVEQQGSLPLILLVVYSYVLHQDASQYYIVQPMHIDSHLTRKLKTYYIFIAK